MSSIILPEALSNAPALWNGLKSGFVATKQKLAKIRSSVTGQSVDDLHLRLDALVEQLEETVNSLEGAADRLQALELELERDRRNNEHNQEIFEAVWYWSQQSWWKRLFSTPVVPVNLLWRK